MKLGQKQTLTVVKKVDFGVYLGNEEERVLLPKKQVPEDIEVGDPIEVFLYKDSSDRLIATTKEPYLLRGDIALLKVIEVSKLGAFLDWGLEKDLFLPYKEQTYKVQAGDSVIVSLYVDKSSRLCATMKVYHLLETDSPYHKGDMVKGRIYDASDEFGLFVAVDNLYSALIPRKEVYGNLSVGQEIEARVADIKKDGKLDLSVRERIPEQMDKDAQIILTHMESLGGSLPYTDKVDPERIKEDFNMSKAAFKRAIGKLLKAGVITIEANAIKKKSK